MSTRSASLCAVTLAALLVPMGLARAGDLDTLQGRWQTTMGPNQEVTVVLEVQGTDAAMTFKKEGSEPLPLKGKIALDDAAAPKTLDWVDFLRPDGEKAPVNRAIYSLEGGVLTVINGGPGNARPTAFPPADQPAPGRAIFIRVTGE